MDQYGPPSHMRPPVPPMRVSSLNSSARTMSSNGGRSSENSSLRSGRSALSIDSGNRTSQESAKPRLSKDQQEYLERRFAEQPKPNTQTKKTFAAELNVPLEKINNWFQNRRAKSKQDARKKQGAYTQFAPPHTFVGGPHSFEQSYIDQSFYHMSHPHQTFAHGWQQPVLPGNSTDSSNTINPTNAQFNFDLDPSNYIPTHGGVSTDHMTNSSLLNDDSNPKGFEAFFGLSNPSHPSDTYALNIYRGQFLPQESFGTAMDTIPEYDIPHSTAAASHFHPMNGGDNSLSRQDTISSEELSSSIPYPPSNGDLPMPPSADFFHPNDTQPDMYSLPTWGQSAGRPFDANDTTMQDISLHHTESQLPYRSNEPSYHTEAPSAIYQSVSSGGSFLDRVQARDTSELESMDNVNETVVKTSNGASSAAPPNGLAQRRDSTMSRLVESIDNVHVQPHALEKRPSQQSIGHPSLASRRQRRPAPLGSSSTRSTSFSSTTPASPKPAPSHSSERELRRIKSSIGTVNGRVHKSGLSGTAQKSPLSFTFSDAATSARASKSLSSRSMTSLSIDTVSRTDSLVPATPVSPPSDDLAHIPFGGLDGVYGQPLSGKDDSIWAHMPNTSGSATESVWSSFVPQNPDSWINFSSPPDTPMPHHQPLDIAPQSQAHQPSVSVASSQFANTWSQSENSGAEQPSSNEADRFSEPLNFHTADELPSHETAQHSGEGSQPLYERSTPSRLNKFANMPPPPVSDTYENHGLEKSTNAGQEQPLAQTHQESPTHSQGARSRRRSDAASLTPQPGPQSSPLAQRTSQPRQSGLNMFHVSDPDLRNLEPGQVPSSLMQPTTTPPRPQQALMIHQYSPSDPVPTERMPPRTHSSEMPKNLTFQMCGPENFSSP